MQRVKRYNLIFINTYIGLNLGKIASRKRLSAQIGVWKIFKNLKVTIKVVTAGLLYAVRACVQFFRNRSREGSCKGQKEQNIWKFG